MFLLVYILLISFYCTIRFCGFRLVINILWLVVKSWWAIWAAWMAHFPDWKVTSLPGRFHWLGGASTSQFQRSSTLQGTNISYIPSQGTFESMIFLFRRWDMLVPWRVGGGLKTKSYVQPQKIGEMIQFDYIDFKWVGEKPPTSHSLIILGWQELVVQWWPP